MKKDISLMTNRELLEEEHDTEVDIIANDISWSSEDSEYHKMLLAEIEKRGLKLLPRLNTFNLFF